ncbi:hypothetical protein GBAR_LOCUS29991, partial [Geodia barretti]
VAVTTDFATRFLTEVREMQVLVLLVALLSVCSWTTLSVDGVTISLNGEPIPNNSISRRSVYDFECKL